MHQGPRHGLDGPEHGPCGLGDGLCGLELGCGDPSLGIGILHLAFMNPCLGAGASSTCTEASGWASMDLGMCIGFSDWALMDPSTRDPSSKITDLALMDPCPGVVDLILGARDPRTSIGVSVP